MRNHQSPNAMGRVDLSRAVRSAIQTTTAMNAKPMNTRGSATPSTSFQSLSALRSIGATNAAAYRSVTNGCVSTYSGADPPPAVHVGGVRFWDHHARPAITATDG